MDVHNLAALPTLVRLPCVVQETRVRIVELVVLYDDSFGQTRYCRDDASGRSEERLALRLALFHARYLNHGPVNLAVKATAQTLGHVS